MNASQTPTTDLGTTLRPRSTQLSCPFPQLSRALTLIIKNSSIPFQPNRPPHGSHSRAFQSSSTPLYSTNVFPQPCHGTTLTNKLLIQNDSSKELLGPDVLYEEVVNSLCRRPLWGGGAKHFNSDVLSLVPNLYNLQYYYSPSFSLSLSLSLSLCFY